MVTIDVNNTRFVGMTIGNIRLDKKVALSDGEFSMLSEEIRNKLSAMATDNIISVIANGKELSITDIASGSIASSTSTCDCETKVLKIHDKVVNNDNFVTLLSLKVEALKKEIEELKSVIKEDAEKQRSFVQELKANREEVAPLIKKLESHNQMLLRLDEEFKKLKEGLGG